MVNSSAPAQQEGAVLCAVGWWPGSQDVNGIFILEHILAIAQDRPVEVLYVEVVKCGWSGAGITTTFALEHGLPVHRVEVRTPVRRFGIAEFLARRAFRKLVEKLHRQKNFEILHIHVRTEITEQLIAATERLGLPFVVTEHNSFYHLGINALPEQEQSAQRKAIRQWFAHPAIAAVMPVSHDLAQVLQDDFYVPRSRITVVPNIAAEVFQPAEVTAERPFHILLAALWRPPKDHDVFISALRSLSAEHAADCRITWAGYGPAMEVIVARCREELPEWDIHFTGRTDKYQLAELMRSANVFVLPTIAENLPCVLLESLACGTPVISMAVNGVPEVVNDSNGILVPPRDPGALAAALVACKCDPGMFDRTRIAREAQAHYSAEVVAERIAEVYRRVTSR